jgi:AcrR family transcriptional regulator
VRTAGSSSTGSSSTGSSTATRAGEPGGSPREARRRRRIELSREQILDTAEEVFSERGYHAAGLKEVADRCEFAVGSIYQFFEGKEHLYEEVLLRRGRSQVAEMERIAALDVPAAERLTAMARLQIEHFRRQPAWGRLTTRVLTLGVRPTADVPSAFLEAYRGAIDLEARLFAQGQAEGSLRQGSPRALARMFSALVTSFHTMDPQVADDSEDLAAESFLALVSHTFAAAP